MLKIDMIVDARDLVRARSGTSGSSSSIGSIVSIASFTAATPTERTIAAGRSRRTSDPWLFERMEAASFSNGFHFFDFETGEATLVADPEAGSSRIRLNDREVYRRGRFVAGSMDRQCLSRSAPCISQRGSEGQHPRSQHCRLERAVLVARRTDFLLRRFHPRRDLRLRL